MDTNAEARTVTIRCGYVGAHAKALGVGEFVAGKRSRWFFTPEEAALVRASVAASVTARGPASERQVAPSRAKAAKYERIVPPSRAEEKAAAYAEILIAEGQPKDQARARARAAYGLEEAKRAPEPVLSREWQRARLAEEATSHPGLESVDPVEQDARARNRIYKRKSRAKAKNSAESR
jgi:hypothetical protein